MDAEMKLVVFGLGGEQYCAPIEKVIEIHRPQRLTRMPRTPAFVKGIFNLRGRVLPVVDAKQRLGLPPAEAQAAPARAPKPHDVRERIMVVESSNGQAGIIVDAVLEVLACRASQLQSPDGVMHSTAGQFLKGVLDLEERMVLVLDLDRMLAFETEGGA